MNHRKPSGSEGDSAVRIHSFSFGIGYLLKFVQFDLGFATHDMLGVTSTVSMIFRLK